MESTKCGGLAYNRGLQREFAQQFTRGNVDSAPKGGYGKDRLRQKAEVFSLSPIVHLSSSVSLSLFLSFYPTGRREREKERRLTASWVRSALPAN